MSESALLLRPGDRSGEAVLPVAAVRAYLGRRGLPAGPVEVGLALRDLGHLVSDQAVRATVCHPLTTATAINPATANPGR